MATPYIADTVLQQAVAVRLKTDAAALLASAPYWATIISDANQQACQTILTVMQSRGYLASTIATWDRRQEFNRRLGVAYALREGGVTGADTERLLEGLLKTEEELKSVQVIVNGVWVPPDFLAGGPVGYGDMSNPDDVFSTDMHL